MSSNSVCNHTQNRTPAKRSSDFVNHSYDYRPNCTPLSPVTITNLCVAETEEDKKKVNSATLASSASQSSKQDAPKDNTKEKMERKNSEQEEKVSLVDNKNGKEQISLKGGSEKPCAFGWSFVSLKTWTVSYQINSLVVFDVMKTRYLLASQPGGTYVILMSSALNQQEAPEEKVMENCFFLL